MKIVVLMAVLMACAGCADQWYTFPAADHGASITREPVHPSPLDGKENAPNSWHRATVTAGRYSSDFVLEDGTRVTLYFTGGTRPNLDEGMRGELYVSVPSYDDDDGDNTYYFQKFVPAR